MRGQGTVKLVKLITFCDPHSKRESKVVPCAAGALFDVLAVEAGVKATCNVQHGMLKLRRVAPHDFDGKAAWILYERMLRWDVGWMAHSVEREDTRIICLSHTDKKIAIDLRKPSGVSTYNARLTRV